MRLVMSLCLVCLFAVSAAAQAPATTPKPAPGIHFVYLLRHGIYDRDTSATDDRVGNALNKLGHEQAGFVGVRLSRLGVKFDRLISSQFLRAAETADDIGSVLNMKATRDSLLNECTPTTVNAAIMAGEKPADVVACDSTRVRAWERYFMP